MNELSLTLKTLIALEEGRLWTNSFSRLTTPGHRVVARRLPFVIAGQDNILTLYTTEKNQEYMVAANIAELVRQIKSGAVFIASN